MKTPVSPPSGCNGLPGAALTVACLLLAGSSLANTVTVTNADDSGPGSLRDAIAAAANNGTVIFSASLTGATIFLTNGELQIGRNLTITGPGSASLTIASPFIPATSRAFNILTNTTVSISGLSITNCAVIGANGTDANPNGADAQGGGILNAGTLTLTDIIIASEAVGGNGASEAMYDDVYGGTAYGGDISNSGTLTLLNCIMESGVAMGGNVLSNATELGSANGGGIYSSGMLTLVNCQVTNSQATGGTGSDGFPGYNPVFAEGGGINSEGLVAMTNCTISYNSGSSYDGMLGGGIFVNDAASLANCTIANNSGGGIFSEGTNTLISCTINGNDAGIQIDGGLLMLENTIVSGNMADVAGTVTSGGFNFIGQTDGSSGWIASDLTGTTAAPFDPQLGPLQNNGGPTPTMAPAASSAVVDQGFGFGIHTDQRGSVRPFDFLKMPYPTGGDGSDIGAVELLPANTLTVTNAADSGPGSLRDVIATAANNDTIIFSPNLTGATIFLTSGELQIGGNLTIIGPGSGSLMIANPVNPATSRAFNILSNTVSISGLSISNCAAIGANGTDANPNGADAQGGGIFNAGTLTLTDIIIASEAVGGNGATGGNGGNAYGGDIYNSGTLALSNCVVENGAAMGGSALLGSSVSDTEGGSVAGGGIYSSGTLTLVNCLVTNN